MVPESVKSSGRKNVYGGMEVRGGLSLIQPIWRIVRQQQETGRVKEKWCVIPWSPTFSNKVVKNDDDDCPR